MQIDLKTKLAYARQIQLSMVYMFGLAVYLFTTIPHNWWIFLTVMMMMSAVQPGLILAKSINRGKGTIVGIILSFLLVYVLHLNYRLVSVVLILSMIFINVPNPRRYDLTVASMTVMVFLSDSYSFKFPLIEGPIEVVINRITCTIIGIAICISADHFLFNRFNYSGKVYRLLQEQIIIVSNKLVDNVMQEEPVRKNKLVLMKRIRDSFNTTFSELSVSSDGILNSHTSSREMKELVKSFSELSWKIRIEVSAIYMANCVVKDDEDLLNKHLQKFYMLIDEANNNLLKVELQ